MLKNMFIKENIKFTILLTILTTVIWSLVSGFLMGEYVALLKLLARAHTTHSNRYLLYFYFAFLIQL